MSTPMKHAFDRITAERDTANQRYQSQISGALKALEAIAGQ